jgi:hypothetical protein
MSDLSNNSYKKRQYIFIYIAFFYINLFSQNANGQDSISISNYTNPSNIKIKLIKGILYKLNTDAVTLSGNDGKNILNDEKNVLKSLFNKEYLLDFYVPNHTTLILLFDKRLIIFNLHNNKKINDDKLCSFFSNILGVDYNDEEKEVYLGTNFLLHFSDNPDFFSIGKVDLKNKKCKLLDLGNEINSAGLLALDNQFISYSESKYYVLLPDKYKTLIFNTNLELIDSVISKKLFNKVIFEDSKIDEDFQKVDYINKYFKTGNKFDHLLGCFPLGVDTLIIVRREKSSIENMENSIDDINPSIIKNQTKIKLDIWINKGQWVMIDEGISVDEKWCNSLLFFGKTSGFINSKSLYLTKLNIDKETGKPTTKIYYNIPVKTN